MILIDSGSQKGLRSRSYCHKTEMFLTILVLIHYITRSFISEKSSSKRLKKSSSKQLRILYESDCFLIVSKPPDVYINHEDPSIDTLATRLKILFPSKADPQLVHGFRFVHRLDYATSGVICLALSASACKKASRAFEKRTVVKQYLALLRGHLKLDYVTRTSEIGADTRPGHEHKMTSPEMHPNNCEKPRSALTHFQVVSRGIYDGCLATKVLITIETGRRHQIRVHSQLMGHPIVGDFTYGADVQPPRMYLHAFRIVIPLKEEIIDIMDIDPFTHNEDGNFNELANIIDLHKLSDELTMKKIMVIDK